ncbi:uncharacterized protein E5676_scaffold602G00770 [Cucumis melo var. makuwa]|uniref:Uncharacterized protein n=1 Tax=Cucumis melo var. makuwa TaxID=1194695 RepID=A0A5A7VDF5_CUCMM|nr:uncharacterized protein E6C27_scaffold21G004430 [Cucumis melo var. makuwa]TYK00912.1 uncharacterized protein E5676_scaffold602G00770 [Cucumis melo var. makuwa]
MASMQETREVFKKEFPEKTTDLGSFKVGKSIARPKSKIEDMLVKVDKFTYLTDFIILDYETDQEVSGDATYLLMLVSFFERYSPDSLVVASRDVLYYFDTFSSDESNAGTSVLAYLSGYLATLWGQDMRDGVG